MIGTHVVFKKLVAKGMSEELAEAITEIMEERQDDLVTKSDLRASITEVRAEIAEVKADIKWLKGMGLVMIGLLIKIAFL